MVSIIPFLLSTKAYSTSNTVSGTITDSNNTPILANIYLLQNLKHMINLMTNNSTGAFSASIASGTYDVVFSQANQTLTEPRFFYLTKSVTISSSINVNLIFQTITISGQLTDSNNNPISGAIIDSGIGNIAISGYNGTVEDVKTTDSNGNFVLHLFPATFKNVKITLSSGLVFYPTTGKSVTVITSGTHNIKLATPVQVTGTILDQSSNPALVRIELVKDDLVESTMTDKTTGVFSFNVQPSQYGVKISSVNKTNNLPRFFEGDKIIDLTTGGTFSLNLPVESWTGTGLKWSNGTLFNGIAQFYMPINIFGWTGFSGDQVHVTNGAFSIKLIAPSGNIAKESFGTPDMVTCTANNSTRTITC